MFDSRNRTPRQGGYRQNENSREQNGAKMSTDGASFRPRFNPNACTHTQEPGARRRQRIARPGATRVEKVEARPSFRNNNEQHGMNGERSFRPRPTHNPGVYSQRKRQEYVKNYEDPTKPMRLNKYLANAGICSRREADDFIQAGVITVNGEVVDNLGAKVLPTDKVMFHDQPVRRERKVYILLNKPKNTVTTTDDPQERHTVLDIVRNACAERIYPVGRLDRNTTGVLLLTNDGDLAAKLTHPKFGKKKIYAVTLDRDFEETDEAIVRAGVILDDEKIVPDALEFPQEDRKHIGLEIHSGQNRVVRRMFEKVGYKVVKLDRVSFAGLTKKNVARGKYRFLTPKEVAMLQMGAFE
jgi:23S rRNA pseudouridine2605 synthase